MQQKKKARTPYQYEPLVTPNSWKGDDLQYAVRLTQIVDDLYQKYGALREENEALKKRVKELENANA